MASTIISSGFCVALLFVCFSVMSVSSDLPTNIELDRLINSSVCIARSFCKPESAVSALMKELSLTTAEAEEIVDYTHNTSGIKWRSCSCEVNCALNDNCCVDASTELSLVMPESLKTVSSSCDFFDWSIAPVVDSCPEKLPDMVSETVRTWCVEGVPGGGDFVKMTSSKSYATYSNVYCAMCHGESALDLEPWSYKLQCKSLPGEEVEGNSSLAEIISASQCIKDPTAPQIPPKELTDKISAIYGAIISDDMTQSNMCATYDSIISSCPPSTEAGMSNRCTQGKTSYVTTSSESSRIYRNPDCAVCNNIVRDDLVCQACSTSRCMKGTEEEDRSLLPNFAILVQPYPSDGAMACQAERDGSDCTGALATVPTCNVGEYLDTVTAKCAPLCPPTTVLFQGLCVMRDSMNRAICDESVTYEEYLEIGERNDYMASMFSNNAFYMELNSGTIVCHSCTMTVATLHDAGLVMYPNGSASLNITMVDRLFISREGNFTYLCLPATTSNEDNSVNNKQELAEILYYQDILTFVLCLVSIIFLFLFFIAFFLIKRMRNIPGSTIAGNMLMFLLGYIVFLARGLNEHWQDVTICYIMGVMVNYFFLSAFVFMIIYALLIIRSLELVDLDSRYTSATVAQIWLAGILLPFISIIPALLLDVYEPDSVWSPGYGGEHCFMSHREGNIIFFTVPIAVCLLITMTIYVVVVHRLRQIAAATSRVRDSHREKVYLCMKLIIVLGFNWISAVLAASVSREKYPMASEILSTIFIILCCLHGFFGFIVFVVSGSNIELLKARYSKLVDSNSSTGGGRTTRTYSGQPQSTTVASELSTMIHKPSPKDSPASLNKFSKDTKAIANEYNSTHDTLNLSTGDNKSNDSPISNRSVGSKKCDFF